MSAVNMLMNTQAKSGHLSAVVTRVKRDANGNPILDENGKTIVDRVENLGLIAYSHRNPFINWAVQLWISFKELFR